MRVVLPLKRCGQPLTSTQLVGSDIPVAVSIALSEVYTCVVWEVMAVVAGILYGVQIGVTRLVYSQVGVAWQCV